jgi:hypothetical protein
VTSEFVSVRIRSESIPGGVCVCSVHAACMPHTRVHVTSNQGRLKKTINATFHPFDLQTPAPVGHHYQLTSPCFSHLGVAALACSSAPHISAPTSPPQITALTSPVMSAPRQLNLLPPHSMSAPRYMAPRPVTSTPRSRSIFRNLFKRGVFVNFFPKGQKRKKRASLVVGMPAGRALPQARWTNPHRIPASGRNSARITNAAPCGQPVSAGGAANPARQRIVEREVQAANREEGDRFSAILLRAACSRTHVVAVCPSRTSARYYHRLPADPSSFSAQRCLPVSYAFFLSSDLLAICEESTNGKRN